MNETVDLDAFRCFLDETIDSLADLGSKIVRLETGPNSKELLEEIFRPVHGIKGNAGFFELTNLVRISHRLEDLLQDLRSGKSAINREVIDILIEGIDILTDVVNRVGDDLTATELTEQEKEYIEKIVEYRSKGIAVFDLPHALQSLTGMLSELSQLEIDPNALPHANQTLESVNLLIEDIKGVSKRDKHKEFDAHASYALNGKDLTNQVRLLFDLPNRLENKKGISSQLAESFKVSFYEIFDALDASQQKVVELDQVEPFFGFLDDSFLNQSDDFIKQICQAVRSVVQHLETTEAPGEVQKIGEILVGKGKISEQDLADTLNKQKPLGQILLNNKKIEGKDLAEALAKQSSQVIDKFKTKGKTSKDVKTIRIQQGKLDEFIFLVGELTMNLDTLEYIQKELAQTYINEKAIRDLKGIYMTLNDVAGNLENSIMKIRKVPARSILKKFPALVRTLSKNIGKQINMEILGDEVLVDKDILEKVEDPLVHLIRNSVDHGIEVSVEERVSRGKPEQGKITVVSKVDKTFFYLDVSDDGQGIDPDKMRTIASQKGFLKEDELRKLNDQEAKYLIFNSGFSSARKVSDISGRGVGLDVVKKYVEGLGGSVTLDSEIGLGTEFHIKIPLTKTLVTKEALFVEDSGNVFAVPSAEIERVVELNADQLRDDKECLMAVIQDRIYSFKRLNVCVDSAYGHNKKAHADKRPERGCGLILKNQRAGLLVEKILDFSKIVVKDLEQKYLEDISIFEGLTIRGDGQIVMVLKLEQILSGV